MYIGTKPITRTEGKGEHSRAIGAFPQINSPDENVAGACARTHITCARNRTTIDDRPISVTIT